MGFCLHDTLPLSAVLYRVEVASRMKCILDIASAQDPKDSKTYHLICTAICVNRLTEARYVEVPNPQSKTPPIPSLSGDQRHFRHEVVRPRLLQ